MGDFQVVEEKWNTHKAGKPSLGHLETKGHSRCLANRPPAWSPLFNMLRFLCRNLLGRKGGRVKGFSWIFCFFINSLKSTSQSGTIRVAELWSHHELRAAIAAGSGDTSASPLTTWNKWGHFPHWRWERAMEWGWAIGYRFTFSLWAFKQPLWNLLLPVEVEFLRCHWEKNLLRPSWEHGILWKVLLMLRGFPSKVPSPSMSSWKRSNLAFCRARIRQLTKVSTPYWSPVQSGIWLT